MGEVLESAWRQASQWSPDAELGRLVMAGAIIDKVDAGVRDRTELVEAAVAALRAATVMSRGASERPK